MLAILIDFSMSDQLASPYDEQSPLLSKEDSSSNSTYSATVYPSSADNIHGICTPEKESTWSRHNQTESAAFVSGVGTMPIQGGSLKTLPLAYAGDTTASVNAGLGDYGSVGGGTTLVTGTSRRQDTTSNMLGQRPKSGPSNDVEKPCPERQRNLKATELALPNTAKNPTIIQMGVQESGVEVLARLFKKYWKPTLILTSLVTLLLVVVGVIIVPLEITDPCKNLNLTNYVYTDDTILVTNSSDAKFCGRHPTIFLPNYKTDLQPVHIYDVDCNALQLYPTNITVPSQKRTNRKSPLTLFGQYVTERATITQKLNVTISSTVSNEIFVCIFDDVEFYNKNFDLNDHWRNATSAALQCTHRNVTNQTVSFDDTIVFNKTSYYYIGIAGAPPIDMIQWSYEGWTSALNHSDYKDSELKCMVSNGCTPTNSCVVAYAEPPANGRYSFSSVRTVAGKSPLTTHGIVSVVVGCVGFLFFVVIVICSVWYCYCSFKQ